MNLTDSTVDLVDIPCSKNLSIDEAGPSPYEKFGYPFAVGHLNYLQGHSGSNITMATSQRAQYVGLAAT